MDPETELDFLKCLAHHRTRRALLRWIELRARIWAAYA